MNYLDLSTIHFFTIEGFFGSCSMTADMFSEVANGLSRMSFSAGEWWNSGTCGRVPIRDCLEQSASVDDTSKRGLHQSRGRPSVSLSRLRFFFFLSLSLL